MLHHGSAELVHSKSTFAREAKWTQTGTRFHFGWKSRFGVQSTLYLCSHELRRNETQNGIDFCSIFSYTFLTFFYCFSSNKLCFYHFIFHFFNKVSNFCNKILTNQKPKQVIRNCQWNCMWICFAYSQSYRLRSKIFGLWLVQTWFFTSPRDQVCNSPHKSTPAEAKTDNLNMRH